MTYTPDQIARARKFINAVDSDFGSDVEKIVCAAIAATEAHVTERACEYLESVAAKRSDHMKIAALRNKEHLREPGDE